MNITCFYDQTPFTLSMEEKIAALRKMHAENLHHYDARCPRCGRANAISRERLEMFTPGWEEAIKAPAAAPMTPSKPAMPTAPTPSMPAPSTPAAPMAAPAPKAAPARRRHAPAAKKAAKKAARKAPKAKRPAKKKVAKKPARKSAKARGKKR
jgi:hypothetical protein